MPSSYDSCDVLDPAVSCSSSPFALFSFCLPFSNHYSFLPSGQIRKSNNIMISLLSGQTIWPQSASVLQTYTMQPNQRILFFYYQMMWVAHVKYYYSFPLLPPCIHSDHNAWLILKSNQQFRCIYHWIHFCSTESLNHDDELSLSFTFLSPWHNALAERAC